MSTTNSNNLASQAGTILLTLALGYIGAGLGELVHLPVPALLGSGLFIALLAFTALPLSMPTLMRNIGFTILGVSFDSKKENWLKAVEKDKLTWTQVSDLGGWGNAVGKMYGIKSIPQNLLIDKEGKIIAKNLRGEDLYNKLAEVLK